MKQMKWLGMLIALSVLLVVATFSVAGAQSPGSGTQVILCPNEYRWGTPAPGYSFASWPIFESWNEVQFVNNGVGDAFNVTATIADAPGNVTVVDGNVALGDISSGGNAWSTGDTFTLQVDMASPSAPAEGISWTVEYDDAAGSHHIVSGVPQFCGIDQDDDGYTFGQGDCDDFNAAINPGAEEVCDGVDNDCDGSPGAGEVDVDGDGWMVCEGDCKDTGPWAFMCHPGKAESCSFFRLDEDCDGTVDEGCVPFSYADWGADNDKTPEETASFLDSLGYALDSIMSAITSFFSWTWDLLLGIVSWFFTSIADAVRWLSCWLLGICL